MAEEKIEKGVISEEALEEIAGGINVSKETLKKVAIGAGVTVLGLGGIGYGGKNLYDYHKSEKKQELNSAQTDMDEQSAYDNPYEWDAE